MLKLPPIEKIPEAYSAIEDGRIEMFANKAIVKASNYEKEYLIKWQDNLYYSNDNSTYWQGYPGYPVIAVLMLQKKLSLNKDISKYFQSVDWHTLNKQTKRDYKKSLEYVLKDVPLVNKKQIFSELQKVLEEIQNLPIELTRKKI